MSDVFIPKGGAGRLPIQACSRMPVPERGLGFQEGEMLGHLFRTDELHVDRLLLPDKLYTPAR